MEKKLYAVLILNYNTVEDAWAAAQSVVDNALSTDYIICIADNASSERNEREKLNDTNIINTIVYQLDTNSGYANGNNFATEYILKYYDVDYIVIMNPDVQLMQKGTIEGLIGKVEEQPEILVGAQPLVWNVNYGDDPRVQLNIRKTPTFWDVCILSFLPLRFLFWHRYRQINYLNKVPYKECIQYNVPSGAFFLIRREVFCKIGMFDPDTFLYWEEYILGHKLQALGKKFIFDPTYTVRHFQGKSTGQTRFTKNIKMTQYGIQSKELYLTKYLKVGKKRCAFVHFLSSSNILLLRALSLIAIH